MGPEAPSPAPVWWPQPQHLAIVGPAQVGDTAAVPALGVQQGLGSMAQAQSMPAADNGMPPLPHVPPGAHLEGLGQALHAWMHPGSQGPVHFALPAAPGQEGMPLVVQVSGTVEVQSGMVDSMPPTLAGGSSNSRPMHAAEGVQRDILATPAVRPSPNLLQQVPLSVRIPQLLVSPSRIHDDTGPLYSNGPLKL